ncbi:MAG: GerMN domain-containing protein [Clostridiales bacterium]|jgi:hypothetical protein|nr:GerMN domain-containing protein [Clostridiales bacterium]
MKKFLYVGLTLCLTLLSAGCGASKKDGVPPPDNPASEQPDDRPDDLAAGSIQEYFPVKADTYYEYESSIADLNQQVFVTCTDGAQIQRRVSTAKVSATEVLEYVYGELRFIFGEPGFYYYEKLLPVEPAFYSVLLREPLHVGQTWRMDETRNAEITAMDADVSTLSGDYKAMEITTSAADGKEQKEYYAPGVGLVKTVYTTEEYGTLEIELARITEETALNTPAELYFLNGTSLVKEEKTLPVTTNCDLAALFTEAMRTSGEGHTPLLPPGAKIQSIETDRANNRLRIDLSREWIDAAGDSETIVLQGVVNTIGHFYDAREARVTIGGEDYQSANLHLGPDDWLSVEPSTPETNDDA